MTDLHKDALWRFRRAVSCYGLRYFLFLFYSGYFGMSGLCFGRFSQCPIMADFRVSNHFKNSWKCVCVFALMGVSASAFVQRYKMVKRTLQPQWKYLQIQSCWFRTSEKGRCCLAGCTSLCLFVVFLCHWSLSGAQSLNCAARATFVTRRETSVSLYKTPLTRVFVSAPWNIEEGTEENRTLLIQQRLMMVPYSSIISKLLLFYIPSQLNCLFLYDNLQLVITGLLYNIMTCQRSAVAVMMRTMKIYRSHGEGSIIADTTTLFQTPLQHIMTPGAAKA